MQKSNTVRSWISKVVPGYEELETIAKTGKEFQVGGRTYHAPRFSTPDGKARMFSHELPNLTQLGENQLRLMTVRSEGQFNTVVYEEYDLYRHQERRDIILMHPTDMERFGLHDNQLVTVSSETGRMHNILARGFEEIRDGNALMYYPESNVLVPRTVDPKSRTPLFKNILITISKQLDVVEAK